MFSKSAALLSEQLPSVRFFSGSSPSCQDDLKAAFAEALPKEQARLKALKTNHGTKDIHNVNVNMVIGGMRGITGLLYETSLLDADEGIRFRGHSIPELQARTFTLHEPISIDIFTC
jgi:citrate synthase